MEHKYRIILSSNMFEDQILLEDNDPLKLEYWYFIYKRKYKSDSSVKVILQKGTPQIKYNWEPMKKLFSLSLD